MNAYQKYRGVAIHPKILEEKKNFSEEEKKHLTRKGLRWYVYFDFIDPKTDTFKRQTPITSGINRNFPDFDSRLFAVKELKNEVLDQLKSGYNPYEDDEQEDQFKLISSLEFALRNKENKVGRRTFTGYEKSVKAFIEWLKNDGKSNLDVKNCNKKVLVRFLDHISKTATNRTRNNYRSDLSAVFSILVDQEYITKNPVENVKREATAEKRDPNYSDKQVLEITDYLKEDRVMIIFIYFVSYMFWRPKENCRLKVKDVNLEERKITTFIKQGKIKTKLIPEILIEDLREYLKGADPEDYVFTPEGTGKWDRALDGRRSYFTLKYKRLKKIMGVDPKFTIYSFRHYYITKVFKNILKEVKQEDKAISILSKITGHTSKAVWEYIHYTDASLPEDYSKYLK